MASFVSQQDDGMALRCTLVGEDWRLLGTKTGARGLGFAMAERVVRFRPFTIFRPRPLAWSLLTTQFRQVLELGGDYCLDVGDALEL